MPAQGVAAIIVAVVGHLYLFVLTFILTKIVKLAWYTGKKKKTEE